MPAKNGKNESLSDPYAIGYRERQMVEQEREELSEAEVVERVMRGGVGGSFSFKKKKEKSTRKGPFDT